jgi:hypothetical protein
VIFVDTRLAIRTSSASITLPSILDLSLQPQRLSVVSPPSAARLSRSLAPFCTVDRAARRLLTSFLQYLSLAAGFVLISMASAMRFNQAEIAGVDTARCSAECDYMVGGTAWRGAVRRDVQGCGREHECVRMWVYVCACVRVCMRARVCVCVCACVPVFVRACM